METTRTIRPPTSMTLEEFVAFYDSRPDGERWELIDGEAIMMTPPTRAHDRIGDNLARALNNHFERSGRDLHAHQRAGLIVPDADRFRPEADVAVEDASADYESYTDRFYLVAEVISDNNTTRQIAVKRRHYMAHPDNQYCMIIAQKKVSVELRSRASDRRRTMLTSLDDTLSFSAFGFVMPVAALYTGTPLAKRPAPPAR